MDALPWEPSPYQLIRTFAVCGALTVRAQRKRSLTFDGIVAAWIVGIVAQAPGLAWFAPVAWFYITSTKLTRLGAKKKDSLTVDHRGGARGAPNVLFNSLPQLGLVVIAYSMDSTEPPPPIVWCAQGGSITWQSGIWLGYLAGFAACTADTWSSEIGMNAKGPVRLITAPWRRVPPGTNGGVTSRGLIAGLAGGSSLGTFSALFGAFSLMGLPDAQGNQPEGFADALAQLGPMALRQATLGCLWGLVAGAMGTIIDSLLGATVQWSGVDEKGRVSSEPPQNAQQAKKIRWITGYDIMDNHMVNGFSVMSVTALGMWAAEHSALQSTICSLVAE